MAAAVADAPTGVVVMAYGSPAGPDELEAYYTDIRRGRPPTPEQLTELRARYDAIGGISPLAQRARAQVAALQEALDEQAPGRYRCALGPKHAPPMIEDAVAELAAAGVDGLVGIVLAPHYSALSVQQYLDRVDAAAAAARLGAVAGIPSWFDDEGWVDAQAGRVRDALSRLGEARQVEVLFTAHSLPARILDTSDPYPEQLAESAETIARRAGVERWRLAWQSAGRTPEPWLGPDLLDVLWDLAAEGKDGVVVCPHGFTSDHLEVLYDIDIEARRVADACGLRLERTASLNDDPALIGALARAVLTTEA